MLSPTLAEIDAASEQVLRVYWQSTAASGGTEEEREVQMAIAKRCEGCGMVEFREGRWQLKRR